MKHFREEEKIEEINGLICFREAKKDLIEEKEYISILEYYVKNFENIINSKKARSSKKIIRVEEIKYNNKME